MSKAAIKTNQTVTLDVGGTIYRTTRDTLSESNYLVNLVDGGWMEGDETIFIDRDGLIFRYVLFYLRNGEVDIEQHHLKNVKKEAQFYLLPGLENMIDQRLKIIDDDINKRKKEKKKVYKLLDLEKLKELSNIDGVSAYDYIFSRRPAPLAANMNSSQPSPVLKTYLTVQGMYHNITDQDFAAELVEMPKLTTMKSSLAKK